MFASKVLSSFRRKGLSQNLGANTNNNNKKESTNQITSHPEGIISLLTSPTAMTIFCVMPKNGESRRNEKV